MASDDNDDIVNGALALREGEVRGERVALTTLVMELYPDILYDNKPEDNCGKASVTGNCKNTRTRQIVIEKLTENKEDKTLVPEAYTRAASRLVVLLETL